MCKKTGDQARAEKSKVSREDSNRCRKETEQTGLVTVEAFLEMLLSQYREYLKLSDGDPLAAEKSGLQEFLEYGRKKGFLEAQEEVLKSDGLTRQQAARILHNFLRLEMKEADEADWGEAAVLLDLYDCHTCVNHIAQVYAKGIAGAFRVTEEGKAVFGTRQSVPYEEAKRWICRIFDKSQRSLPGKAAEAVQHGASKVTLQQISELCRQGRKVWLVDVRTRAEYEQGCPPASVFGSMAHLCNLPLTELLENARIPGAEADDVIIAVCDGGYRSEIAANCLSENGYCKVYDYGWGDDFPK